MRLIILLGAFALLACLAAGPGKAAPSDPYRVEGVPVDASAESAVAARDMALDAGQREALRLLLRRLTLPEDEERLPPVDDLPIERLVRSFEIASEKVAPTRYVASLNVTFDEDRVRDLLRDAGVPFLERGPEPVLVLPALATEAGGLDLWGEANPWRAAWNEGAQSPVTELRLPLGDAGDVSGVPPGAVLDGGDEGAEALRALAGRYGASSAAVALARPVAGGDGGLRAIELEVWPSDAPGEPYLREEVVALPGEDEAALWSRAAARAAEAVGEGAKARLIAPERDLGTLQAAVPLADLRTWVQIRRTLEAAPEVRAVRIDRLSRSEAVITMTYAGDLDRLVGAMRRAGLALAEENGQWLLRRADDLGAYRAPLSASPATP